MADWVELRVHGVHGTSPGAMLGVADGEVAQVAGDRLTGVYRVTGDLPLRTREIPAGLDGRPGRIEVEAYSWGALTSSAQGALGWVRRVGWMLLLPFALANLAYWARLHVAVGDGRDRWGTRAVRASGVLLTVFMVITPCVVAVDMLGWQCFAEGVPRCSRLPGVLDFLAGWTPGQRLLLTAVVPLLALFVLAFLSRQTTMAYEVVRPPTRSGPVATDGLILRRRTLWASAQRTIALRRLHVAAGCAAVVAFVGLHVAQVDPTRRMQVLQVVLVALAGAVVLGCLVLAGQDQEGDLLPDGEATGPKSNRSSTLGLVAFALVAVEAVALWSYRGPMDETAGYQGADSWLLGLFVLLTALHLAVFFGARMRAVPAALLVLGVAVGGLVLVVLAARDHGDGWGRTTYLLAVAAGVAVWALLLIWHYRRARLETVAGMRADRDPLDQVAWRGAGASLLLAAAAWVGLLFTSCAVIAAANYLNGARSVADLASDHPPTVRIEKATAFAADGEVVIRNAVLTFAKGTVVVHGGSVTADRFTARSGDEADPQVRASRIPDSAELVLSQQVVDLRNSCRVAVYTPGTRCTAAADKQYEADELPVRDRVVRLESDARASVSLKPRERVQSPLLIPQVLAWTPLAQLAWLLLSGLALAWCVARFRGTGGRDVAAVLDEPDPPDDAVPVRDRRAAKAKRVAAGLSHRAETLLDVVGAVTSLVAVLLIVSTLSGQAPWDRPDMSWTRGLATVSFYVTLALGAGLVMLSSSLRRSEATRKAVGVIWDLSTFWPRAAHPLAPPCYAERVVPELKTRARWVLDADPGNRLVLSGHSQGSLIVASMASRLDDADLARVRVITYGSQIRALYGRVFPRVFGAAAIGYDPTPGRTRLVDGFPDSGFGHTVPGEPVGGSLRQRLEESGGSWVSLFRRSDPLGFRVFSDEDGALPAFPAEPRSGSDLPVMEVPLAERGDPGPTVATHSGYQQSAVYRDVICRWTHEVPFEDTYDPAGVVDLPGLPRT